LLTGLQNRRTIILSKQEGVCRMKIIQITDLINIGRAKENPAVQEALTQIVDSITQMVHPMNENGFILFNEKQANGVKPIKNSFITGLDNYGWKKEHKLEVGNTNRPGPIDATYQIGEKFFAVEWETGNISSSHRAINKMVIGILNRRLIAGVLILPSRDMYYYLTDRVGNFKELEPYFSVYQRANYDIDEGYLGIIEIEHDDVSNNVSSIPKGTDGRARI